MSESSADPLDSTDPLDVLPVVVVDATGTVHVATPAVDELPGLADGDPGDLFDRLVHPADAERVGTAIVAVTDGPARTRRVTFRCRDAPGTRLALELTAPRAPTAVEGVIGVFTDVTGRTPDPEALADVGGLLSNLLGAEDREDLLARFLAWTAPFPGATYDCQLYDPDEGGLVPVAPGDRGDGPADQVGPRSTGPPIHETQSGLEAARETFRTGHARVATLPDRDAEGELTRNEKEQGEGMAREEGGRGSHRAEGSDSEDGSAGHTAALVPIGDHGVLVAEPPAGPIDRESLLGTTTALGAVLGVALDRVTYARTIDLAADVARRTHEAYTELQSIANTVRRAQARILEADSTETVHAALCEELATTDAFAFAWVGEVDFQAGTLSPSAWAGKGRLYLDHIDRDVEGEDPPPSVVAAATREPQFVPNVAGGATSAPWRREALSCGFQSVLAIPIGDRNGLLGVLTVYRRDPGALDEPTRVGLSHLCDVAGFAIDAIELRKSFFGTTAVEVKLHVPTTESPLSRFAREVGEPLEVMSVVSGGDGGSRLFFTTEHPPEETKATAERIPGMGSVTHHADRADVPVFETTVTDGTLLEAVTAHGAILADASADADGLVLTVQLDPTVDVRTYVESVRMTYPGTDIVARRLREEPIEAGRRFRADYEAELSDRQREVFEAAFFGGYFGWPRDRTGSEIAASLGISQPTFSRHLRAAERKLAALLFEDGAE